MQLTQEHKDIFSAKLCPYCGSSTRVVDEVYIYGRTYKDRLMVCCKNFPQCDSYVGTHEDGEPLGRLANKELRQWKKKAHDSFDKLWKDKKMKRGQAYAALSKHLGIHGDYTHIGMFKIETCIKVAAWSKLKYEELL